jgi:hypothetical protein
MNTSSRDRRALMAVGALRLDRGEMIGPKGLSLTCYMDTIFTVFDCLRFYVRWNLVTVC